MIQEGNQVIIKTHKVLKPFQVRKDRVIRVEKSKFRLDGAIGFPFGTTFEVKRGELVKVENVESEEAPGDQDCESERDNRHLKDEADNQKLKKEDLQALRKKGADVVEHLVENSATFKEKTEFAQQKYIKKKKKKWESRFTLLKPTTRLVAEMYYLKGPARICHLRHDSLAQLMTYANVRAHAKIMLCESVAGLVLGAILERLGGYGSVVQFYSGSHPSREALECFGFPAQVRQTMLSYPLVEVSKLRRKGESNPTTNTSSVNIHEPDQCSQIAEASAKSTQSGEPEQAHVIKADSENSALTSSSPSNIKDEAATCGTSDNKLEADNTTDSEKMIDDASDVESDSKFATTEKDKDNGASDLNGCEVKPHVRAGQKRRKQPLTEEEKTLRRERRQAENARTKALLEKHNMDALIVASKQQPTPIVLGLIDFLAPGRPIAVHSMYKEPLLDCYVQLRNKGGVVNLKLSETWLRQYQVLPMRTHPGIQMSGTGGYLLTGTTTML